MLLSEYLPKSALVLKTTLIDQPRFLSLTPMITWGKPSVEVGTSVP